jgi:PAS domain S-box-containing protein
MILKNRLSSINSKPLVLNSPLITILVIALLYFALAKTGFLFTSPTTNIAPIFLATGLGLSSVLIVGRNALIGIWIGAFLANLTHLLSLYSKDSVVLPLVVSAAIATGAVLGALTACFFVRFFCKEENVLNSGKNVLVLLLIGTTLYSLIAALCGVLALTIFGFAAWKNLTYSLGTWWLSDTVGGIILAPFVLAWYHKDFNKLNFSKIIELPLLGGATILLCYVVFFLQGDLKYLLIPLALSTAYRFGVRITATLILVITVFSTIVTSSGIGPFIRPSIIDSILLLDLFISVLAVCSLFLAGVISERKRDEDLVKVSEKELRNNQDILQSTIESPKGISIFSLGRNYEYMSFNTLHRINMQQMNNVTIAKGMKLQDCMVNKSELQEAIDTLEKVFLGESLTTVKYFEATNSYWELRSSPIVNEKKEIIGATMISSNIDDRIKSQEALKKSEEKYREIFNNIQDVIFQTDPDGVFLSLNPSIKDFTGYVPEELIGRKTHVLQPDEKKLGYVIELIKEKTTLTNYETLVKTKSGEIIHVSLNAKMIFDKNGNWDHIDGIARDITKMRKNEREIAFQNHKLQIQNKELEQFAYITSHDLQEPLLTLNCFTELVKEEFPKDANENIKQYLDFILESSYRMQSLVKGLLDYSRIGRQIELANVDCNEIAKEAISSMSDIIEKTNTRITIEDLPYVKGYSVELIQLFQHLLANSIKFRKNEIALDIAISSKLNGDSWEFIVKDNGIGIEDSNKEKIFVIFKRLNNREEYPGIGIGLAICKKIVALHGGTIWADSKFGEGTTIHFTLPNSKL